MKFRIYQHPEKRMSTIVEDAETLERWECDHHPLVSRSKLLRHIGVLSVSRDPESRYVVKPDTAWAFCEQTVLLRVEVQHE